MDSTAQFSPANILDLSQTDHAGLFFNNEPAWAPLGRLGDYLREKISGLDGDPLIQGTVDERAVIGSEVFIAEGVVVEANAVIKGPAWIGAGSTVRSGAYVRENVIVGDECVLGNSSEFKNCLLFNKCEAPHFNYVGDSILGYKGHLGAGVICSNVRLDRKNVHVKDTSGGYRDTGLRKFGAIVGDYTEVGCNTVLSPGSILGRHCIIYPCLHWHGVLPEKSIAKNAEQPKVAPRHLVD